jgi:O-antigen/teichoic acid export membrane protein
MGGTTVVRLIAGFFVFVLVARYLGAGGFGVFIYWTTVASLIAVGINFGTGPFMLRELGARPELRQAVVGRVGAAKLLLTAAALAGSLAAAPFLGGPAALFLALLAMAVGDAFSDYVFCAFRGGGDYLTEVWMSTISSMLHLLLVWLAIGAGASALQLGLVFAVSRLSAAGAALLLYRHRYGPLGVVAHWRAGPQALRENRSYALDALLTNVYTQLDSLLLNHLAGPAALGVYQAGMRLLQGLNNVAPVLSNVYLPKLAGELHGRRDHRHTATMLYLQLVGFGALVALLFTLFGELIARVIYGAKFAGLGALMPWIGCLLLLRLFASNYGILLSASGQQTARVWAIMASLLALLATALWLVPRHGALGMIWSAMAATLVLAGIYCHRVVTGPANPRMAGRMLGGLALVILLLGALLEAQTYGLI